MESDCLSDTSDSLFSWGSSSEGQTGLGSVQDSFVKVPTSLSIAGVTNVKQIACGGLHTLLLADNGRVYSCGNNDYGQLGHDKSRYRFHEIEALRDKNIVSVDCGEYHSIALTEWGHVFTWGNCNSGQLGLICEEETIPQPVPKLVKTLATKQIIQACCGDEHCMALTSDGELYSWGSNEYGQLGLGNNQASYILPQEIKLLSSLPIAYIACGGYHSFALSKSGAVYGWGKNTHGQLGVGDQFNKLSPSHLVTLRTICVKYIDCGEEFSVFLTQDGGVFSCGAGYYGQLGHGTLSGLLIPKKIMDLMGNTVTQISCGRRHTLAFIPSVGKVYAFGVGKSGQLGINSTTNSSTPQVVKGPWMSSERKSNNGSDEYVVRRIYSGGNYCFVTVSKKKDGLEIEDCRYLHSSTQILTVDLTKLKQCVELQPFDSIDPDLLTYVETVMGSLSCLNGSFLKENEHYGCCSRNSGIDVEYLTECFQVISTFKHPSLQQVIMAGIGNVIANIPSNLIDMEMKRIFIILPMYHDFTDTKHYDWLHMPFAERYLISFDDIDEWLENINEEYFTRVIIIFKMLFLDQLKLLVPSYEKKWDREFTVPLNIMSKLHRINERCWNGSDKYGGHKVPYSLFQVPEINDKVDIRQDYVRWYSDNGSRKDNYFCNYSFLFDAQGKTTVLLTDQAMQMHGAMQEAASRAFSRIFFSQVLYSDDIAQFLDIHIHRNTLVMDTIQELDKRVINELKKPLRVHFIGEEAEDAGGVRKEFFMLVFREILDPKYGMFKEYDNNALWFREDTFEEEEMFTLIGILCGLAIYNFTIINLPFPLALYKKLLQEPTRYQDIKGLSPAIYRSFEDLLNYTDDDIEDVFDLRFEITKDVFGEIQVVPLIPNGENIRVNNDNKKQFVELYVDMVLNKSVERTFVPFYEGFHRVCGGRVLQLFQAHELMQVVIGNEDYDWKELEKNTEYKGGYTENDETIRMFWDVFHNSLNLEDKRKFLLYLTGTDRIPIQGMKAIRIIIQPTNDDKYLPVAHTCFNLLDLPRYKTKERLRYKLVQAIQQTEGFSLV